MDEIVGTDMDGYAVVAGHWPLMGPHSPARTAYAAQALTALVRYLDAAADTTDGLPTAADAALVEAAVREAQAGLPAVLSTVSHRRANLTRSS
jgi:hypothetical protein